MAKITILMDLGFLFLIHLLVKCNLVGFVCNFLLNIITLDPPIIADDHILIWKHHRNFASKSAYASILQSSFEISTIGLNPNIFKILWHLSILSKWKFFAVDASL